MRIRVLCVGEARGEVGRAAAAFEARARRYWRVEIETVPAGLGKGKKSNSGAAVGAEEERLLARLPDSGEIVALTREGSAFGSRELARFLEERAVRSVPEVAFVIGGAFGLGKRVLGRSDVRLSLSAMTLPHELARLVLAEQLYRAGTILRHEPYHKGP